MNARRMPVTDRLPSHWPPSGDEVGELLARLHDHPGGGDHCAAWYVQVSTRTVRRWRDPRRTASSVPFAAWTMLAGASGLVGGPRPSIETILPGVSSWNGLGRATRGRVEEAISSTLRRQRWRPTPDLVALLVSGPEGCAREGRGVRATARALRVEPSTVLRWIDTERPTSAVPYAAWVMLLARERRSTLDRALVAPLDTAAQRERAYASAGA